jgi:hypothetical protein
MRTTRFWNILHQVSSKSKGWKVKRQRQSKENGDRGSPPPGIGDLSRFWRSYLGSLVYLLAKLFKLFGFPTFRFWAYLMKVIPETRTKFDIYVLFRVLDIALTPKVYVEIMMKRITGKIVLGCDKNN